MEDYASIMEDEEESNLDIGKQKRAYNIAQIYRCSNYEILKVSEFLTVHEGLNEIIIPAECCDKIASFLSPRVNKVYVSKFKQVKLSTTCIDNIASYLPAISGPPIYTIAHHLARESDEQIHVLYRNLCELFDGDNDEFIRSRLCSDFVVNDAKLYAGVRHLNTQYMIESGTAYKITFAKGNISTTKFMELSDFGLNASKQELAFLTKMKEKLDRLTGRDCIENEWKNSEFCARERSQMRLCYNYLLQTCLLVG